MPDGALVFVLVMLVVVIGCIAYARIARHPEDLPSAADDAGGTSRSDDLYTDTRPAGPDVESDDDFGPDRWLDEPSPGSTAP